MSDEQNKDVEQADVAQEDVNQGEEVAQEETTGQDTAGEEVKEDAEPQEEKPEPMDGEDVADKANDEDADSAPKPLGVSSISINVVENGFIIQANSEHSQLQKVYVHRNWHYAQERIKHLMHITDAWESPDKMKEPDEAFLKAGENLSV